MNEKESAAAEINPPVCLIYDRKLKISQYFCLSLQVQHSVFFFFPFFQLKKKINFFLLIQVYSKLGGEGVGS